MAIVTVSSNAILIAFKYIVDTFSLQNNYSAVQIIIAVPSLSVAILSLFISFIEGEFNSKKLTLYGLLTVSFSGLLCKIAVELQLIKLFIILRIFIGIGNTLILTGVCSIAKDVFSASQRQLFFSLTTAVISLSGIAIGIITGLIIKYYYWTNIFVIYIIPLLVALPFVKLFKISGRFLEFTNSKKFNINLRIKDMNLLTLLSIVFFSCCAASACSLITAPILLEKQQYNIRNFTAMISIYPLGNLIGSFIAPYAMKRLNYFMINTISIIIFIFGLIIIYKFSAAGMIIISYLFMGMAIGVILSVCMPWAIAIVKPELSQKAITITNATLYLGFFSGAIVTKYSLLLIRSPSKLCLAIALFLGIFSFIINRKKYEVSNRRPT